MTFSLPGFDLDAFVASTLAEDLGPEGRDVTSEAVIPADAMFDGVMDTRDAVTLAGLPVAAAFFRALDPDVVIELLHQDGDRVAGGTDIMRIRGKARAMLTAERSALNTVQHLSGIATMTRAYVDAIDGTGATLLDTRKTIPGLRVLEKYATRMGGATNHRMGLWDAAMIKDNHVAVAGSVEEAVRRAVDAGVASIIVEVDRIDQIEPALAAGATHLLLDNMDAATLRQATALVGGRVPTEASGGVTLETIRARADTGVTYISVGRLTQSAPAADIGLDFAYAKRVGPGGADRDAGDGAGAIGPVQPARADRPARPGGADRQGAQAHPADRQLYAGAQLVAAILFDRKGRAQCDSVRGAEWPLRLHPAWVVAGRLWQGMAAILPRRQSGAPASDPAESVRDAIGPADPA